MSAFGGSDSAVRQSTQNAPLSATDQALILSLRGSSTLGPKNSGNVTLKAGATYAPQVTYTTQGYTNEALDAIAHSFQQTLSSTVRGLSQEELNSGADIGAALKDRVAAQITNAPHDAAKEKKTFLIIMGAILAIAAAALFLGRKS